MSLCKTGAGLAPLLWSTWCLMVPACVESMDEALFLVEAEPFDEVQVIAEDASVELVGSRRDDEIRVVATRTWSRQRPRVRLVRTDGRLHVSHDCKRQRVCDIQYTIFMPEDLGASVVSDGGSVLATRLAGDLMVDSVWGEVFASGMRSAEVVVATELGDVTLAFERPPERVSVATLEGHVTISVPQDEDYRLELETERGETSLVDVTHQPDADRSIGVSTDGGDITLRGTPPVDEDEDENEDEDDAA